MIQYIWLKNSLLVDFITYLLLKSDCEIDVQDHLCIAAKSLKKALKKKKHTNVIYQMKLTILMESVLQMHQLKEENALTNETVLEELIKRLRNDLLDSEKVIDESEV